MKAYFVFFLIFFVIPGLAQTVKVNQEKQKVKGEEIDVFATTLDGEPDGISAAFNKYLKSIGKLKQNNEPMLLSEPTINGAAYTGGTIYAAYKKINEKSGAVWLGIIPAEWTDNANKLNKELEGVVYQFGLKYYRDKVQVQIDEAQQAVDAVERQKQRTLNQHKDLTQKLTNNELQKVQLEKSLEANKLENGSLKVKIENNKKAQDSLANVSLQVKKVLEQHKEKQRKIN